MDEQCDDGMSAIELASRCHGGRKGRREGWKNPLRGTEEDSQVAAH